MIVAAANILLRTLLAPACASCRIPLARPLSSPVCPECWRAAAAPLPPVCHRCGALRLPFDSGDAHRCGRCLARPSALSRIASGGPYAGALREIIHAFKYEGRRVLAAPLARLMRDAGHHLLADADLVVPVPLHPLRGFERGFNQADDLARHLGLPVARLLRRTRHGPPQATLPASRRHLNVRSAFALRSLTAPVRATGLRALFTHAPSPLPPLTIVLIDDVVTTGETMEGCGEVLRAAGAREVRGLTVARALPAVPERSPPRPDPSTVRHR